MVSGGAYGSERSACWTKRVNAIPAPSTVSGIIDIKGSQLNKQLASPPSPPILHHSNKSSSSATGLTIANVAALPSSLASTISTSPASESSSASSSSGISNEDGAGSEISFSSGSSSSASSPPTAPSSDAFLRKVFGEGYVSEFARNGMKSSSLPTECIETLSDAFDTDNAASASFSGAVLESPAHGTKTLYVAPPPPSSQQLDREGLVALMDAADDEHLACNGLVIVLDKHDPDLGETLHSLLYVGGQLVPPDEGLIKFSTDLVLVGLDL